MRKHCSFVRLAGAVIAVSFFFAGLGAQPGAFGKIDFPTSGAGRAQEHFIAGMLFLHNFEFDDAREEFQKARTVDPDFAMAYWGEALTHNHPLWRQVDVEAGREALKRLAPTAKERRAKAPTRREKDFLASLERLYGEGDKSERDRAYHDALEKMYRDYPDDHEVASLYALSILGLTDGTRNFPNYMRAASIVERVFAENPRHPGAAHYLIHAYDDPIHAPLGLRAARVYNKIAPDASHAQHMISHIYVALGRWDESSLANERAWAVSRARVERKKLDANQADFHAFFWLHYSYLQQGRYKKAHSMLQQVEEVRQAGGGGRLRGYHARMRAQQVIETGGRLTELPPSGARFHDHVADILEELQAGRISESQALLDTMEPQRRPEEVMKKQLHGLVLLNGENPRKGLALLREAAREEDALPLSFGPPSPSKPAHEQLGEVLLGLGQAAEAQRQFEAALDRAPRRSLSLLGLARAARRAGDMEAASQAEATLRSIWKMADPEVLEILENLKESSNGAAR